MVSCLFQLMPVRFIALSENCFTVNEGNLAKLMGNDGLRDYLGKKKIYCQSAARGTAKS